MGETRRTAGRRTLRWSMAALFTAAGIAHLAMPEPFVAITPDWVPWPRQVVLATGALELLGSMALMTRRYRRAAGIAFALYALAVWPANIKHAVEHIPLPPIPDSWWYHGPRLALQPVIVWWALYCGELIDWPFAKSRT